MKTNEQMLRDALVGLVGTDGKENLVQMKNFISKQKDIDEEDKLVSLNAIKVLIETL